MQWLNYHHLLYFWAVAREGSIAAACRRLHLTQPTISSQIKQLERSLKAQLLERRGRSIGLTETGRVVYRYADEIFSLGRELEDAVAGRASGGGLRFVVGVADTLPKLIVHRLLAPALDLPREDVRVTCVDGDPDQLLAQLALHELDLLISDYPANPRLGMRAFNHPLGDCGVSFLATPDLARRYSKEFPRSLDGAPMLLPAGNAALRAGLEQWFDDVGVRPKVRGEFSDSALLKAFGGKGEGVFLAPTVVEEEVIRMYGVAVVGRDKRLRERFYAISVEKRIAHPAVLAITRAARASFAEAEPASGRS
jgi:LysR family transcriptional regulator, transcriptional activator of nhaA